MSLNKSSHHHRGHHAGREDLAGEHKAGDAGQIILLVIFLLLWVLDSILLYPGLICITLSLASLVLWIFIIVFYWYISRHEEKLLLDRFGDEYKDYKRKVPMLFPLQLFR